MLLVLLVLLVLVFVLLVLLVLHMLLVLLVLLVLLLLLVPLVLLVLLVLLLLPLQYWVLSLVQVELLFGLGRYFRSIPLRAFSDSFYIIRQRICDLFCLAYAVAFYSLGRDYSLVSFRPFLFFLP